MESVAIDATDGVPVVVSPLAGLESGEAVDAGQLARELRAAALAAGLKGQLAPKVSVAIDAGGALNLDAVPADVRLQAETGLDGAQIHVALGGDAASAVWIGTIAPNDAVEAATRLLAVLAARGPTARARAVIGAEGDAPFRSATAEFLMCADRCRRDDRRLPRPRAEPISSHALRDGTVALGIGLAFGHTDVDAVDHLVEAACAARACGLRSAPDRLLLIVGLEAQNAGALAAVADSLGFVTSAGDPRRSIAACPGAPLCACTAMPTRALAPAVAIAAEPMLDGSFSVHLSGCVKGCAHPAPAALTIVGANDRCGLVVNGAGRDRPAIELAVDALPASLARLAASCAAERRPGENAAGVLSRLGAAGVAAILAESPHA
jgi:precorrin-3B synthase